MKGVKSTVGIASKMVGGAGSMKGAGGGAGGGEATPDPRSDDGKK
jgi:hypothetical protein